MYCTKCGTPIPPGATSCPTCGQAVAYQAPPMPAMGAAPGATIPNYLVQAILVTLCCCLPFGVVAIIYAAQVNSKLAQGDTAGAMDSSKNAKMWCWIAFAGGVALSIVYALMFAGGMMDAIRHGH